MPGVPYDTMRYDRSVNLELLIRPHIPQCPELVRESPIPLLFSLLSSLVSTLCRSVFDFGGSAETNAGERKVGEAYCICLQRALRYFRIVKSLESVRSLPVSDDRGTAFRFKRMASGTVI